MCFYVSTSLAYFLTSLSDINGTSTHKRRTLSVHTHYVGYFALKLDLILYFYPTNGEMSQLDTLSGKLYHSSANSHAPTPALNESAGMEVWFILVISIRSVGPWKGSAIKSGLWLGLFNTVSVKWLKVNGTLTQSDRNGSCSWSKSGRGKVGATQYSNTTQNRRYWFTWLKRWLFQGRNSAVRERCFPCGEAISLR